MAVDEFAADLESRDITIHDSTSSGSRQLRLFSVNPFKARRRTPSVSFRSCLVDLEDVQVTLRTRLSAFLYLGYPLSTPHIRLGV